MKTNKNKYFDLLSKILVKNNTQTAKKASSIYSLNETLTFNENELLELFSNYKVAKAKLSKELELYMQGETRVNKYNKEGINWWDYCSPELVNSYPTYFKELENIIKKVNTGRGSKNNVLFIGSSSEKTNQLPCLSLIQFQVLNNALTISVYQRSADSNLGLPSDLYQVYLISKMINFPLKELTFFIGNAHIYENNIEATNNMLNGKEYKFNLNV